MVGTQLRPAPFQRISFEHAMARYGSDKPDRRYGLPIVDVGAAVSASGPCSLAAFDAVSSLSGVLGGVKAVRLSGLGRLSRKDVDLLKDAVNAGSAGSGVEVAVVKVEADGEWRGALAKRLTASARLAVNSAAGATVGDLLLLCAGEGLAPCKAMGAARTAARDQCVRHQVVLVPEAAVADAQEWTTPWAVDPAATPTGVQPWDAWRTLNDVFWVTHFPLFEQDDSRAFGTSVWWVVGGGLFGGGVRSRSGRHLASVAVGRRPVLSPPFHGAHCRARSAATVHC